MKQILLVLFLAASLHAADIQVFFSSKGGCTEAAEESNAENLLVIQDPALAAKYTANWQAHLKHSDAYSGKPD
jgi:hypothetical protein